jgi:hypothetical protein
MPYPARPIEPRATRAASLLAAAALLGLTVACAPSGSPSGPRPQGTNPTQASGPPQGFDTSIYPGDALMRGWRTASPYRWVGYYLPAPCHRDPSWSGKRASLEQMGWGTAVVYLGQQDWVNAAPAQPVAPASPAAPVTTPPASPPPAATATDSAAAAAPAMPAVPAEPGQCATVRLTAPQGTAEADDAIAKALAEGFPAGTSIYLDVERVRAVSPALQAYVRAWVERVLTEGRYRPALYVHAYNAQALYDIAHAVYDAHGLQGRPRFWIANASGFSRDRSVADVGFPFADVWQGQFHVTETWGGQAHFIDVNLSTDDSPSAPPR